MEEIKAFFSENDQFAKHCGIELLEVTEGGAKARVEIKEHHLNGVRMGHGGIMFTLADFIFAAACNSYGTVAVAVNASITYFTPVAVGDVLHAEAQEISKSRRLGNYEIRITNQDGAPIARFQGLAYRKKDALPL